MVTTRVALTLGRVISLSLSLVENFEHFEVGTTGVCENSQGVTFGEER